MRLRLLARASTGPAIPALWLGLGLALVALGVGALLAFAGPIIAVAALLGAAAGVWALLDLEAGLWGTIAIITLLPFAALPFKIVFTPNFVDLSLMVVALVYGLQWMTGRRRRLTLTPAHGPLAVFIVLAVFSFVAGLPNGPLTANLLRQFGELLLNMALTVIIVDYVDRVAKLKRLVRVILLGGAAAAAIGLFLYALPPALSDRLLSGLAVFGYPAGGVLRYVEDNPENAQRAISTSVDPNFLGGMLAMIGGLLAPQLLARRGVLGPRWMTGTAGVLVLAGLVLTYSRSAMAGLAAAVLGIALLRYRRLLWVLILAAAVLILLPATGDYVARFVQGVRGEDLATQMRLGEYKDAFILISRYPVLGVGFAGAPEIDIYLGVSSAYLLMAEQMGLVGLAAFLFLMATVLLYASGRRREVLRSEAREGGGLFELWLGTHAGLVAALVVGVLDHYFFKLSFQSAGTLFWLFVGLCLASTRLGSEEVEVDEG